LGPGALSDTRDFILGAQIFQPRSGGKELRQGEAVAAAQGNLPHRCAVGEQMLPELQISRISNGYPGYMIKKFGDSQPDGQVRPVVNGAPYQAVERFR